MNKCAFLSAQHAGRGAKVPVDTDCAQGAVCKRTTDRDIALLVLQLLLAKAVSHAQLSPSAHAPVAQVRSHAVRHMPKQAAALHLNRLHITDSQTLTSSKRQTSLDSVYHRTAAQLYVAVATHCLTNQSASHLSRCPSMTAWPRLPASRPCPVSVNKSHTIGHLHAR